MDALTIILLVLLALGSLLFAIVTNVAIRAYLDERKADHALREHYENARKEHFQ